MTSPTKRGSRAARLYCTNAQLFNVNTTCHNIPLGGSGSSVTPVAAHLANRTAGHSNTDSFQKL